MSGPKKAKRGIPSKSDFNAWYPAIVEIADLVDKRYPIKGMDVWKPYGLKSMNLIDGIARREMNRTGHQEHRFPSWQDTPRAIQPRDQVFQNREK